MIKRSRLTMSLRQNMEPKQSKDNIMSTRKMIYGLARNVINKDYESPLYERKEVYIYIYILANT